MVSLSRAAAATRDKAAVLWTRLPEIEPTAAVLEAGNGGDGDRAGTGPELVPDGRLRP